MKNIKTNTSLDVTSETSSKEISNNLMRNEDYLRYSTNKTFCDSYELFDRDSSVDS